MATVTINNSQQRQVEQQMLVNQLVDNGLLSSIGKIYKRGGMRGLAKKAGSIGGGMASKAGGAMKTQARAAGIQAKRVGLRAGKAIGKSSPQTRMFASGMAGGAVGAGVGAAAFPKRKKK